MKFGDVMHRDYSKRIGGKNFEFLKIQNGGRPPS